MDDDANGLDDRQGVALKSRITINGSVEPPAQAVIHGRGGKDLDLIINFFHPFNPFYGALGIGFQRGPCNLAHQSHIVLFDFVADVVEDTVIRQHQDFVPHFLLNSFFRPPRNFMASLIGQSERRDDSE